MECGYRANSTGKTKRSSQQWPHCRMVNTKCGRSGKEVRHEEMNILYLFYQPLYILEIIINAFLIFTWWSNSNLRSQRGQICLAIFLNFFFLYFSISFSEDKGGEHQILRFSPGGWVWSWECQSVCSDKIQLNCNRWAKEIWKLPEKQFFLVADKRDRLQTNAVSGGWKVKLDWIAKHKPLQETV